MLIRSQDGNILTPVTGAIRVINGGLIAMDSCGAEASLTLGRYNSADEANAVLTQLAQNYMFESNNKLGSQCSYAPVFQFPKAKKAVAKSTDKPAPAPKPCVFEMTIGDYSHDGHCDSETFRIISNKSVKAARAAHFNIHKLTGIDIDNLCSCYGDRSLPAETVRKLESLGYSLESFASTPDGMGGEKKMLNCPEDLANIWIFLLQVADPELKLSIYHDPFGDELPGINGSNCEGWIGNIGYGLFTTLY